MARYTFASLDQWARKTQRRMEAIAKESAQRVMLEANSNVPIVTGFAQASFTATLNRPADTVTFRPGTGGSFQFDSGAVALTIDNANIGRDVIYGVWTANYVRYLEYGARGRPGRGFLRLAAQKWPQIVAQVTTEAKLRVG